MPEYLILNSTNRDVCCGLKDGKFKQLMALCFDEADAFSLSKHVFGAPMYPNYVEDLLAPHLKKSFRTEKWFAYSGGTPLEVSVYAANDATLAVIGEYYRDVFLMKNRIPKKKFEQPIGEYLRPSVLEDICFLRDRRMFFGTLSHEYICAAKVLSQKFKESLVSLASWSTTDVERFWMSEAQY